MLTRLRQGLDEGPCRGEQYWTSLSTNLVLLTYKVPNLEFRYLDIATQRLSQSPVL